MKNLIIALGTTSVIATGAAQAQQVDSITFCQNAFFAGDSDNDDMINSDESAELGTIVFTELDLNTDGSIDREEFVACTGQSAAMNADGVSRDKSEDSFVILDANKDGSVSLMEYFDQATSAYKSAMESEDPQTEMTTGFGKPFVYIDENMISGGEKNMQDRATFLDTSARGFAVTDADLDGTLSRDEWLARADEYEIDIQAINGRFDAFDLNNDGALDADEFQTNWDTVIGTAEGKADMDGFTDQSKGVPVIYFYMSAM